MGVDLSLLPFDHHDRGNDYSDTVLRCARTYKLYEAITAVEETLGEAVPRGFNSHVSRDVDAEDGYGKTVETPYGEPLKYIRAHRLVALSAHEEVSDNYLNRAVWAYLACLPPETKVALYWS